MPPENRVSIDRVRRQVPRFLTVGEVNLLLLSARGTVHRDIIYVLVRTGVRAAELAALRWEDVDLERRVIYVGGRVAAGGGGGSPSHLELLRGAQLARDAELKEAVARLDGIERDLRYWSGRLVPELGLAMRMFGRVICRGPVRPTGGFPEPAELRRQIEELTEQVNHANCARELSSGGRDFTPPVRERATGPPRPAPGIPGRRKSTADAS